MRHVQLVILQLDLRDYALDGMLGEEEEHFKETIDKLKLQLDAANNEYNSLSVLLTNGTKDREDKVLTRFSREMIEG